MVISVFFRVRRQNSTSSICTKTSMQSQRKTVNGHISYGRAEICKERVELFYRVLPSLFYICNIDHTYSVYSAPCTVHTVYTAHHKLCTSHRASRTAHPTTITPTPPHPTHHPSTLSYCWFLNSLTAPPLYPPDLDSTNELVDSFLTYKHCRVVAIFVCGSGYARQR